MFLATQPSPVSPQVAPVAVQPPPPVLPADGPRAMQPPPPQPASEETTRLFQALTPPTPPTGLAPPLRKARNPVNSRGCSLPSGAPIRRPHPPGTRARFRPPSRKTPASLPLQSPMYPTPPSRQSEDDSRDSGAAADRPAICAAGRIHANVRQSRRAGRQPRPRHRWPLVIRIQQPECSLSRKRLRLAPQ